MGYQAITQLAQSKIQDNIDYSEVLKESIVDSLVCVIHGSIYSAEADVTMETVMLLYKEHWSKLQLFISEACERKHNPTVDFVKDCLAMLTDLYNSRLKEMGVRLDKTLVMNMMTMLEGHKHKTEVQQIVDYASQHLIQSTGGNMM